MADHTLNDVLQELHRRGIVPVKIASGYYIGHSKQYVLCKCSGDAKLVGLECECGTLVCACSACLDNGEIRHCPKCRSKYRQRQTAAAKSLGLSREDFMERLMKESRLVHTPIDFDALIAERKLERISATRFKLLVNLSDLPEHVQVQIVGIGTIEHRTKSGNAVETETIVEFNPQSRPQK